MATEYILLPTAAAETFRTQATGILRIRNVGSLCAASKEAQLATGVWPAPLRNRFKFGSLTATQTVHKLELFHGRDSAVSLRFLSNTGSTRHINSLGGTSDWSSRCIYEPLQWNALQRQNCGNLLRLPDENPAC